MFREVEIKEQFLLVYHISSIVYASHDTEDITDSTLCGITNIAYLGNVWETMYYNDEIGVTYTIDSERTCKKCVEKSI